MKVKQLPAEEYIRDDIVNGRGLGHAEAALLLRRLDEARGEALVLRNGISAALAGLTRWGDLDDLPEILQRLLASKKEHQSDH